MIKKLILAVQFALTLAYLQAQNITGTVFDSYSNKKLSYSRVTVKNLANGNTQTANTNAYGEWQMAGFTTSIESEFNAEIADFQIFPNPFTNKTSFSFYLPQAGNIRLTAHNSLGMLVENYSSFLNAGTHTFNWIGGKQSGMYIFQLSTDYGVVNKKVIQISENNSTAPFQLISSESNIKNNKRGESFEAQIIVEKLTYYPDTLYATISDGATFDVGLSTIHRHSLMIDMHNDVLMKCLDQDYHLNIRHNFNHTDIPRLQEGAVDIQVFVAYNNSTTPYITTKQMFQLFKNEMSTNSEYIEQAFTADDAQSIVAEGKIAAVLVVEGGHTIENSKDKLIEFYNEGMRYMTITWNNSTDWAISAKDTRSETVGLSEFGKDIIRAMDSLGVIIDVSHTGIKTIEDILQVTKNPIIASHSGVREIKEHYRNLYDEQIIAIAEKGGVIGVPFYPYFLGTGSVGIPNVISHVNYLVDLVGIDHVGIGSDFDGIEVTPTGLSDVSKFPDVTLALIGAGYTIEEIEKILGGNFMRIFRQVCVPPVSSKK